MNQENLEYLKKSLKYLGFGEKLDSALENMIKEQPMQFQLKMTGEFKHPWTLKSLISRTCTSLTATRLP
jgi:hypothetical protein